MITELERAGVERAHSLQIWSLSDGRAGNARQADALARALGGATRSLALQPRAPWRWLAPHSTPGGAHAFGAGFAQALAAPPELAIGCGRQAALATRLLRRAGAQAVQILDPRIDPAHWDLVVAPEHDHLQGDNVVQLLGSLHPVDDAWLSRGREDFPALAALPAPRTVLLLGGPTRHAPFDAAAVSALLDRLLSRRREEGGSLLATLSRRTPPDLARLLQARAAEFDLLWTGASDTPNPYPGLLGWADRIVCSPDSVNMVSEACATTAPVHVFGHARSDARPRRFLDALAARGRLVPQEEDWPGMPATPLRETGRVADEVRRRLQR